MTRKSVEDLVLLTLVLLIFGAALMCGETQNSCVQSAEELAMEAAAAQSNAPPGWDFCTMPSFYTRACEACPMTVRWSGGPIGCPTIAICGNHAKPCIGEDGLTYPIKGQTVNGQFDRYPIPNIAAGQGARDKWNQCYILHDAAMGCATAIPLPGVLTYVVKTFAQVPEGPQKEAWRVQYGCGGGTTPTPTPTPVPTPPPGPNPYAAWIEELFHDGITGGCGPGPIYCPTAPVTRQELAVFLEKVMSGSGFVPPPCHGVFLDVPCGVVP